VISVADATLDWVTANQAHLQAEFDLLAERIAAIAEAGPAPGEAEPALDAARAQLPAAAAIDAVAGAFGLSAFERGLLLLAAGVEADPRLSATCGAATLELASAILADARWEALAPSAPLRRYRLVSLSTRSPLATAAVRIEERVLFHLMGVEAVEPALVPLVRAHRAGPLVADSHRAIAASIAGAWEPGRGGWPVIQLVGDDPEGQEDVAALAAAHAGWELGVLRAADVPPDPRERDQLAALWSRESLLAGAALLITDGEDRSRDVTALVDRLAAPTFVATRSPVPLRRTWRSRRVTRPSEHERRELWGRAVDAPDALVAALAGRFPVGARAIAAAAEAVPAALAGGDDPMAAVRDHVRPAGPARSALTRYVEPLATWDELVLPDGALGTLREIAAQVRNRAIVHDEWGFATRSARGLGITALFTGESGTGKTLAAEVLSRDLALDLHVIDLSAVVSKYIGETEKNLRHVFDAAEDGAVLLFDEADALFGRRTDVKDSHDRYANLEVSYLLQRMEAYRGLAVLTTNAKSALDHAFRRRIRFVVTFPFPDAALRQRIWRGVFPPGTPLGRLDWGRLASLDLSGGSIRSIAVNAAFLAADAGSPVRMEHIRAAARQEFAKLERPDTGKRGAW
jgi:hypothetical protein